MTEGYCYLSLIPVRSEPSGKSTMVNQLLFGDHMKILEELDNWYRIISLHDNYEGWVEKNQVETSAQVAGKEVLLISDLTATILVENCTKTLLFGSKIQSNDSQLILNGIKSELKAGSVTRYLDYTGDNILATGYKLMGSPYLWGGRSPFGIDCSGLVQLAFKMTGVNLPRDAWQQAGYQGEFIDLIAEAKAGDIAFFDNEEGRIIHTGILTGDGYIIHASGRVRIDPVDHVGIFNRDLKTYSHKLRIIKRFNKVTETQAF